MTAADHPLPDALPATWLACAIVVGQPGAPCTYVVVRATPDRMVDPYYIQLAMLRRDAAGLPEWLYLQADYARSLGEALRIFARRAGLSGSGETQGVPATIGAGAPAR